MVAQTTLNTKVWNLCQKNILNLYTNTRIFDTICSVTENRQKEVAELSKKVDMMLVIGGRDSSNTNKLYNIAKENCENTFFIESVDDLPVFSLTPGLKIGIAAGASTPASIIKEVKTSMSRKNSKHRRNQNDRRRAAEREFCRITRTISENITYRGNR